MKVKECRVTLDRRKKELQPHGNAAFPCAGYLSHYTRQQEDMIPWHWHRELEMAYVSDGEILVRTPSESFHMKKGDLILLNSNMLHDMTAEDMCELRSLVFDPMLIAGNEDSAFARKYLQPLTDCGAFSGYLVRGEESTGENTGGDGSGCAGDEAKLTEYFRCAFDAFSKGDYGYEFTVRENLGYICLFLCKKFKVVSGSEERTPDQNELRVRKMLHYIHQNFAEGLSLSDVAKAADISERECLRCFGRTLGVSPMQYLLKYRVMQGANFLLENPQDSVSEIAGAAGFDSPSNFSKVFKRYYNCTPREYRKG